MALFAFLVAPQLCSYQMSYERTLTCGLWKHYLNVMLYSWDRKVVTFLAVPSLKRFDTCWYFYNVESSGWLHWAANECSRQSLIGTRYKVYSEQNCMGTYALTFKQAFSIGKVIRKDCSWQNWHSFRVVESVLLLETLFLNLYFWC